MDVKYLYFNLLILFSIFIIHTCADDESECIYGIYVKTGSDPDAGTQSGSDLVIRNLNDWGLMGQGFSYFQPGKQNMFGGKGPCSDGPPCGLGLSLGPVKSDPFDKWYCESIEVSIFDTKKPCMQQHFKVRQWLGKDEFVTIMDKCNPLFGRKRVGDHFRISMIPSN